MNIEPEWMIAEACHSTKQSSGSRAVIVFVPLGGTLFVVATIGRFCEESKSTYKEIFLSAWLRAAYLRRRYLARA